MTPGISQIGPPRTFLPSDRGAADDREVIGLGPGLACLDSPGGNKAQQTSQSLKRAHRARWRRCGIVTLRYISYSPVTVPVTTSSKAFLPLHYHFTSSLLLLTRLHGLDMLDVTSTCLT
jgi:hypothetical protein